MRECEQLRSVVREYIAARNDQTDAALRRDRVERANGRTGAEVLAARQAWSDACARVDAAYAALCDIARKATAS